MDVNLFVEQFGIEQLRGRSAKISESKRSIARRRSRPASGDVLIATRLAKELAAAALKGQKSPEGDCAILAH